MQIHLGYDAYSVVLSQVHDAAAELDEALARTSRQVGHLKDGGWSGAAADSFDAAWHDWLAGAAQVREALEHIAGALATTQRDLAARDDDAVAQLAPLRRAAQP